MKLTKAQIKEFWSKVDKNGPNGCWLWKGGKIKGYGTIYLNGKTYRAHRIALVLTTGVMRCDLDGCHECDNPSCVNPSHLTWCSRKQNMQDAARRGRIRSQKQKLTPDQVRAIRKDPRLQSIIAADYGVDHSIVYKIKARIIWKYI
jgi:hypothetical protein